MADRVMFDIHSDFYADDSDSCWAEPLSVLQTNKVWQHPTIRIDEDRLDTNNLSKLARYYARFQVPGDYVGNPRLRVRWTCTKTTGNVRFITRYRAVGSGESLDQTTQQEEVKVTAAVPGTAWHFADTIISLTAANFVAGDEAEYILGCDGTDLAHTILGAVIIMGVDLIYADA